jgi:WD40 repeat protein
MRPRTDNGKLKGRYTEPSILLQLFRCVQQPLVQVPLAIGDLAALICGGVGNGKPPKKWNWRTKLRRQGSPDQWHWRSTEPIALHSGEITCTVLSKDDSTLFSTCKHSCVKVSAVKDGSVAVDLTANAALSCCDVSPDENRLLVGCWDNRVYMYSLETGRELDRVFAHSDGVSALCTVGTNRFLTSSWDSTIKYWQYTDKYLVASPLKTFLECDEAILCLEVSPDGAWGAAGARNGIVYLLDLHASAFHGEVIVSPERRGDVASVCFASSSAAFVCMTFENELVKYNLAGEQLNSIQVNAAGQVRYQECTAP